MSHEGLVETKPRQLSVALGAVKGILYRCPALSATMLAMIADIPPANLTAALRGRIYLGMDAEAELWRLAQRAAAVLDALLPLRLSGGDWQTLKSLIENGRDAEEIRNAILGLLEQKQLKRAEIGEES